VAQRLDPTPADPRVLALLAAEGFGPELFNERQHEACERVELYVVRLALRLARGLGIERALATPRSVGELMAACGFATGFAAPLRWLLDLLAQDGFLARDHLTAEPRYRIETPLPAAGVAEARAAALARDPDYAPTYAMLDEAAVAYGKVARGEATGERALFQNVGLWTGYFSNANPYYAINNRVGAAAVAARLPARGGRVLEVGAGLGSATAALLWHAADAMLADRLADAEARLASSAAGAAGYSVTGPGGATSGTGATIDELVEIWRRSSLLMHQVCAANGIAYVHVLQPNQYLPGAKPMGDAERTAAYSPEHPYRAAVEAGYPRLVAAGESLRAEGVGFVDASRAFADVRERLYVDDCCHFNRRGSMLLAEQLAPALRAALADPSPPAQAR